MVTTREPEWDETDRAMIDAYQDWRADLHSCGRPLSESLHDPDSDKPDPDYQVAIETCRACMALDKAAAARANSASDKALREAGRNPDSWREVSVFPLSELPPDVQAAIRATRTRPR